MMNISILSRSLVREKLSKIAGGDHESIKYLENLFRDIDGTLPGAIAALEELAEEAQTTADTAMARGALAMATALRAIDEANSAANAQSQELIAQLGQLRAIVRSLSVELESIKKGPVWL